jgi:hypothetical protein
MLKCLTKDQITPITYVKETDRSLFLFVVTHTPQFNWHKDIVKLIYRNYLYTVYSTRAHYEFFVKRGVRCWNKTAIDAFERTLRTDHMMIRCDDEEEQYVFLKAVIETYSSLQKSILIDLRGSEFSFVLERLQHNKSQMTVNFGNVESFIRIIYIHMLITNRHDYDKKSDISHIIFI